MGGGKGAGVIYALVTAALLATQDPLSGPAAKTLSSVQFFMVTQAALVLATPLLLFEHEARRDFVAILTTARDLWRLAALSAIGFAGLVLYNFGLSGAHPVVVTAILNLSPFWAALAAWLILRVRPLAGPLVFAGALACAFAGSLVVAASQSGTADGMSGLFSGTWYFALPVPFFTALSATLVGLWFKDRHQGAAVAAALFTPPLVLLPLGALYLSAQPRGFTFQWGPSALLIVGTMTAAAFGRFTYQLALKATKGDNGFVTMFFLLAPALSGLYCWALAPFVKALEFHANPLYFAGLGVTAISLWAFLRKAQKETSR